MGTYVPVKGLTAFGSPFDIMLGVLRGDNLSNTRKVYSLIILKGEESFFLKWFITWTCCHVLVSPLYNSILLCASLKKINVPLQYKLSIAYCTYNWWKLLGSVYHIECGAKLGVKPLIELPCKTLTDRLSGQTKALLSSRTGSCLSWPCSCRGLGFYQHVHLALRGVGPFPAVEESGYPRDSRFSFLL